jgi:hypothetical protein
MARVQLQRRPSVDYAARACFGVIDELAYDLLKDRVQCHLGGAWLRRVAGSHLASVLAEVDPSLLRELHPTLNYGLGPWLIGAKSHRIAAAGAVCKRANTLRFEVGAGGTGTLARSTSSPTTFIRLSVIRP